MSIFKFKQFQVNQKNSAMKIGTDSMLLGALVAVESKKEALDIGTGTGVLSLMIAQRNSSLQITALEIESNAFIEAQQNIFDSPFQNQIRVLNVDFLQFKPTKKFDLIFSNPPYFENASKSESETKNLARHDDNLPLNLLFEKVSEILQDDGDFWIILPHKTLDNYKDLALEFGLKLNAVFQIYGKENQMIRKIGVFSHQLKISTQTDLVIRCEKGNYTSQYKALTKDYHFNVLK